MSAIDISEITTWPTDLLAAVEDAQPDLVRWKQRRWEIEKLGIKDVLARINPPSNEHQHSANEHAERFDAVLSKHHFVVRHCTRLCDIDVERIAKMGILPLTPEMTKLRLTEMQEHGYLNATEASVLECESLSDKSERRDSTSWILGHAPLREEANVGLLLSHWGGEAIYLPHEDEPLGAVLRSLGKAAIVEALVPYALLQTLNSIGEMLRSAVADAEQQTSEFAFEVSTTEPVQPNQIRNIALHGDDDFEALTGASKWSLT